MVGEQPLGYADPRLNGGHHGEPWSGNRYGGFGHPGLVAVPHAVRVQAEDLDAIVSYDDRLLKAATDAGLATASPRS
jgi:hypothetical protein